MKYDDFIKSKMLAERSHGFEPTEINQMLFDWQKMLVKWAVKQGRCALFCDCGLGKTPMQIEWARQIVHHTGKPVLILAPLAVASQTVSEGVKFNTKVTHVYSGDEITEAGIYITNYERLDLFSDKIESLAGVVLDESSILKAFMGKTRIKLTESFNQIPFRLCCTATPAPNDFMEFGQHCDFLGVMPSNEMLSRWFINDTMNFGTYRLKGHARSDFWRWVSTWAACVSKPSDIGFADENFTLPKLNIKTVTVQVDQIEGREQGELLRCATVSATTMHREMRMTCGDRAKKVAELVNGNSETWIVWCNTNYEADELGRLIPEAIEVRGSDSPEKKEQYLSDFTNGKTRVLITKPSIAGYGLNWQHCFNVVFVGLSYSFEDFYQAIRRSYRFGQKNQVNCHIIQADTEHGILDTVQRKMKQHEEMQNEMRFAAKCLQNSKNMQLIMNDKLTTKKGNGWTLINGDCVRGIAEMPDNSIDFSVYSPPFANLYIYSSDVQDMGNCKSNDDFFEQYAFLIKEKFRITKPGCLSAVHCKNMVKYAGRDGASGLTDFRGQIIKAHEEAGWTYHSEFVIWKDPVIEMQRTKAQGLLFKQLRQDSRYSRAGMPEYVLLFRKWADGMQDNPVEHQEGNPDEWKFIGENPPGLENGERYREIMQWQKYASPVWFDIRQTNVLNGEIARENQDEKHICPLQLDVIDRLLWLYSKEGDLVYSPFSGIGSEGYCAVKSKRRFIGTELKPSYFDLACGFLKRAESEALDLFSAMK